VAETDIFLSYSREDRVAARHIAEAFTAEGFNVWWDAAIRSGQTFDEVIEKQLRSAEAVVVLWSPRSVASRWVRAEATLADRRNKLVPAIIESCDLPLIFELTHAADLSDWTGDTADPRWRGLVSDIRRLMEGNEDDAPAKSTPASKPVAASVVSEIPVPTARDGADKLASPTNVDDLLLAHSRLETAPIPKLTEPTPLESEQAEFYKRSDEFRRREREKVHCLEKLDGLIPETRFVVAADALTIGRTAPAEIIVPGIGVSRAHCTVELARDELRVVDLNSTNGTYIDNRRIVGAATLPVGSILRVGNVSFEHQLLPATDLERKDEPIGFSRGQGPRQAGLARS
jgi:TIR domain/FHA domain